MNVFNPAADSSPFPLDKVAFNNIGVILGSFMSDFLRRLVKGIESFTDPLQPFIDVFTAPIPVISDLAGEPITLLDIAGLFGEVDPRMIEAIANIITLINTIPTTATDIILPFGNVVLIDTSDAGPDIDLFNDHALDDIRDPSKPLTDIGNFAGPIGDFISTGLDNVLSTTPGMNSDVQSFTSGLGDHSFADFIE